MHCLCFKSCNLADLTSPSILWQHCGIFTRAASRVDFFCCISSWIYVYKIAAADSSFITGYDVTDVVICHHGCAATGCAVVSRLAVMSTTDCAVVEIHCQNSKQITSNQSFTWWHSNTCYLNMHENAIICVSLQNAQYMIRRETFVCVYQWKLHYITSKHAELH